MNNAPIAPANAPLMGQQKAPDVMGAVRHEHGHGGRKKASEIIQQYVMQQTGSQQQVNQVMSILAELIQRHLSRLVQFGDTVFWATQHGRGTVDIHIFSLDSPQVMVKRIRQAYEWFKAHGFTKVTSTITDEQQLGVVKASGIPFNLTQTQVNDGQKMVPAYVMMMEIK